MVLGQTVKVQREDDSILEDEPASKPDSTYDAFRAVEDLTEVAQYFYTAAGKSFPAIAHDRDTHVISKDAWLAYHCRRWFAQFTC